MVESKMFCQAPLGSWCSSRFIYNEMAKTIGVANSAYFIQVRDMTSGSLYVSREKKREMGKTKIYSTTPQTRDHNKLHRGQKTLIQKLYKLLH